MSRIEQFLQRGIAWWMSAPMDEKAAIALIVLPAVIATLCFASAPPHHP